MTFRHSVDGDTGPANQNEDVEGHAFRGNVTDEPDQARTDTDADGDVEGHAFRGGLIDEPDRARTDAEADDVEGHAWRWS